MLPFGSHILFNILQNLNPKEDSTDFNKNVRKCARYGIVYFLHDNYESYCPFCFLKGKWCHLKERCFYSHYQICDDCKMFKSIIDKVVNVRLGFILHPILTCSPPSSGTPSLGPRLGLTTRPNTY